MANMNRTYSVENATRESKENTKHFDKEEPSESKSKNFVKRLVANLEKKHDFGHCTADNEFLTKYYQRRTQNSQVEENQNNIYENLENVNRRNNDSGKYEVPSGISSNPKFRTYVKEKSKKDVRNVNNPSLLNKQKIVADVHSKNDEYSERRLSTLVLSNYYESREEDLGLLRKDEMRTEFLGDDEVKIAEEGKNVKSEEKIGKKKSDSLGRKRSFKEVLSSLIGWKTNTNKKNLIKSQEYFIPVSQKGSTILRTSSLQMVSPVYNNNVAEERNFATIRPHYGNKRQFQFDSFQRGRSNMEFENQENCKHEWNLSIEEVEDEKEDFETDAIIRPSAIRSISRKLSQNPGEEKYGDYRISLVSEEGKKINYKKGINDGPERNREIVYDIPRCHTNNAMMKRKSFILPTVDVNVQSEYSAILAKGKTCENYLKKRVV